MQLIRVKFKVKLKREESEFKVQTWGKEGDKDPVEGLARRPNEPNIISNSITQPQHSSHTHQPQKCLRQISFVLAVERHLIPDYRIYMGSGKWNTDRVE